MNIQAQTKFTKDPYQGFYSAGLTMLDSKTMDRFTKKQGDLLLTEDGISLETKVSQAKSGARIIRTVISNNSEHPVTLEMITSFVISDVAADKIHRFTSFWSSEGRHMVDTVNELNLEVSWNNLAYRVEKFGNVGSMPVRRYFPFVALEDSKTGKFTAAQLYTPSSWQIEIVCRSNDNLTIAGGIADRDFGQWTLTLEPGESFEAPRALVAEGTSLLEVTDRLIKAQTPHISPVDDNMGIAFNEYCTTWGNPNIDNMKKIADKLEGKGFQYLVMDSGWYGSEDGYWWDKTGEWTINKNRFPNGLKELADYVKSKGMIPGIWFEPETVGPKSSMWDRTECLVQKDGVPLTIGDRRFLDMEKPEVKAHLQKYVIDNLKSNGFGYIKIDYNDTLGMGCDGPEGPGENLRRKVAATREFYEKLIEEIPGLVIENCSSGGHRLEPSMLELSSCASFSDAHEILSLPIIAANLHYLVRPDQSQIWAVMRAGDGDSRIYYSMVSTLLGRMGLSGDIYDLTGHQWDLVDEGCDFYRNVSHVIKNGSTVFLENSTESYNKPTGAQLVIRKYNNDTLVIYHRFAQSPSIEEFMADYDLSISLADAKQQYGDAKEDFSAQAWLV